MLKPHNATVLPHVASMQPVAGVGVHCDGKEAGAGPNGGKLQAPPAQQPAQHAQHARPLPTAAAQSAGRMRTHAHAWPAGQPHAGTCASGLPCRTVGTPACTTAAAHAAKHVSTACRAADTVAAGSLVPTPIPTGTSCGILPTAVPAGRANQVMAGQHSTAMPAAGHDHSFCLSCWILSCGNCQHSPRYHMGSSTGGNRNQHVSTQLWRCMRSTNQHCAGMRAEHCTQQHGQCMCRAWHYSSHAPAAANTAAGLGQHSCMQPARPAAAANAGHAAAGYACWACGDFKL